MRFLYLIASAQIGMHHIALDGAGAHDRHFDDEIVEFRRFQARQHRHLRAAFDLENADRIGARQHLVDSRIILGEISQGREMLIVMDFEQCQGALDTAQHAQGQDIDLHKLERVDIVLVPFDEGAIVHGGIADRDGIVETLTREHEAADMLGEMARKAS